MLLLSFTRPGTWNYSVRRAGKEPETTVRIVPSGVHGRVEMPFNPTSVERDLNLLAVYTILRYGTCGSVFGGSRVW